MRALKRLSPTDAGVLMCILHTIGKITGCAPAHTLLDQPFVALPANKHVSAFRLSLRLNRPVPAVAP
jgi:hypothetical protein